jgi:hypothetical protein
MTHIRIADSTTHTNHEFNHSTIHKFIRGTTNQKLTRTRIKIYKNMYIGRLLESQTASASPMVATPLSAAPVRPVLPATRALLLLAAPTTGKSTRLGRPCPRLSPHVVPLWPAPTASYRLATAGCVALPTFVWEIELKESIDKRKEEIKW